MEIITINDFVPNKDKVYSVALVDGTTLTLRLTAVEALPPITKPANWPPSLPFRDEPFSLTFLGPVGIRLTDGMVSMQDENGQMLQIGLSGFAEDHDGIYYQAIFN